jgi:hypothetical protein
MPCLEHAGLLDRFDDDLVERLLDVAGPDAECPLTILQVRHLGGAFADHREGRGSHGPVPEPYAWFALGVPVAPEVAAAVGASFEQLSAAVGRHSSGRTLLNFQGADSDPGRWWSTTTRQQLQAVKGLSDPAGLVRSNRPVSSRAAGERR